MMPAILKNQDETIEEYISRINRSTSQELSAASREPVPERINGFGIIFSALSAFIRVYIGQGFFKKGIDGFIIARLASVQAILRKSKIWEFNQYGSGMTNTRPPTEPDEIDKLVRKYSD